MSIDRDSLLSDLQRAVQDLTEDLEDRATTDEGIREYIAGEHAEARDRDRTADSLADFREMLIDQAAVAWVLACVFVRFLEDNHLLDGGNQGQRLRWIAGADAELLRLARDHEKLYFQDHPRDAEREYLLHVFGEVRDLPGTDDLFDEVHNPLWKLTPSADGARDLLELFRRIDPETGEPIHVFETADLDTRFLGDLYQDLSTYARKRFALLQTPEFVEEFILDRTLAPAVEELGHRAVTLIDPACGSGHFLLGAFGRLFREAERHRPADNPRALAQDVLDRIAGVDLNPFAAAIARFRLLVASLSACGITRLSDAPDFQIRVAAGDSLIHGRRPGQLHDPKDTLNDDHDDRFGHYFDTEDPELLREILDKRYSVVVGNPPYITVKDKGANALYRERFESCYRRYSLVCPFVERLLDLAARSSPNQGDRRAGNVGAIVANSFTKRLFGKKLVEDVLPKWDLTTIVDASGAYIPGHGTPTLLLFARARRPVGDHLRTVLGIQGEPETPPEPEEGKVWTEIVELLERPDSQGKFVSVDDAPRRRFATHPWSMQGGGAADLKELLDNAADILVNDLADSIGFMAITGEDGAFAGPKHHFNRADVPSRPFGTGESVRDWTCHPSEHVAFMYQDTRVEVETDQVRGLERLGGLSQLLWPYRRLLQQRLMFGKTQEEAGLAWYEYRHLGTDKLRSPLSIAFAFVATHNHFVLDRGGKVFKQSAPVIKLPPDASEEQHLALLGLLNSSIACFWMKQVFHNKGATSDSGVLQDDPEKFRFEFDATKLKQFPIPHLQDEANLALVNLARNLDSLGERLTETSFRRTLANCEGSKRKLTASLEQVKAKRAKIRRKMVGLQEELDWLCYELYGILPSGSTAGSRVWTNVVEDRNGLEKDDRPYRWSGSSNVPDEADDTVKARLELIDSNKQVALLERPEYKRRWFRSAGAYDARNLSDEMLERRALRSFLLNALEKVWPEAELASAAQVADRVRSNQPFQAVACHFRGRDDFDLTKLIIELLESEAVPYLARQRYERSGIKKRERWEATWERQRVEDSIDERTELPDDDARKLTTEQAKKLKEERVGEIPVPPKYRKADFKNSTTWSLRGKLDVPKERFISYPGAEREADPTPVFGWAGWNHLQRAKALATYYLERKNQEGWPRERLIPLLAGIVELLPWVKQWHNEFDPAAGMGMGGYFEGFVNEECRSLEIAVEDLRDATLS